jgi:DNA repair exonuclease SbcCD ATPase subunit
MIPLRVRLKGFLCYKDEQEVSFDGASLWMLAGLNGSGKSAIFDAVTYALFGHHRGGSQHAHELINKNSDGLAVEFDFLQDGQAYRARRTLQRRAGGGAAGTQLILRRRQVNGNGTGGWEPVDGTSRRAEFDAWVRDNIGLGYETFTSSVLLLQGKAEKLLDSTAKGRFEVLAGIVDLERYQRLHERADRERKQKSDHVEMLNSRLEVLPAVGPLELVEAEGKIAAAEAARQKSREEIERLQALEFQTRQWAELQGRLAQGRGRLEDASRLLADAADIERDLSRLAELRRVLPLVQAVVEQRGHIQESERNSAQLQRQKQKLEEQALHQDGALQQARQKRSTLESRITEEEGRQRQVAADFRKAAALLEKLKELERQENDLARLHEELARLPAEPQDAVRGRRAEVERLEAVSRAVPLLERLARQRDELRQALDGEQKALAARQQVEARGKDFAAEVERFKPTLAEATAARSKADEEATRARTLLDEARRQLRELVELRGAKVCRHCGQALTPSHLREEKTRREGLVAEAEAQQREAAAVQKAAQATEKQTREQAERLDKQLATAREEFVEQRHRAEQARKDVERLQAECGQSHALLPEPFRTRVGAAPPENWLATTFPRADDLVALRQEAGGLPTARQRQREAEEALQQWAQRKAQEGTVRQSLARLQADLPADRSALRRDHARLEGEEQGLDRGLAARRAELAQTHKDIERLSKEREQTQQQLTALQGQQSTQEEARRHCKQALGRALKELSPAWQAEAERAGLADVHAWSRERDELIARQTDERGTRLQQARLGIEVLRQDLAALDTQQEQFPDEARREPAQVQALLQEARQAHRAREDELIEARHEHERLERLRAQREQVEEEKLLAERELHNWKTLAELLGRERLQLHLIRQAERQVVDHANAVLDRLSGGELCLRLCGEAGGEGGSLKALDLEAHNRTTGEKPINVAFLSGSQKFRVAVSLALGIGQYASRQHRPLESVIIDEGFGCLDRNGRQVMIQELQNLRSHMRCILLVSHQEEFADAFADGYRFELQGGTTVATRFQR